MYKRQRTYFISGADDFFFVEVQEISQDSELATIMPSAKIDGLRPVFQIECKYLVPAVRSMGRLSFLKLSANEITTKLVTVRDSKSKLRGTRVFEYILFGEKHNLNKKTKCASRSQWYTVEQMAPAPILWVRRHSDRHMVILNDVGARSGDFYRIFPKSYDASTVCALLNSTFVIMSKEIFGRVNLGGGALKTERIDILRIQVPNPSMLSTDQISRLERAFEEMCSREVSSTFDEIGLSDFADDPSRVSSQDVHLEKALSDRRELDEVVFEALGLTEAEQLEVYRAVAELVKNRLVKAGSV